MLRKKRLQNKIAASRFSLPVTATLAALVWVAVGFIMDNIWAHYSRYPWLVPPQLGSWEESMRPAVRKAMEIMDGIQLWWLREPEVDLCAEWAEMENLLFPEPLWDAYR